MDENIVWHNYATTKAQRSEQKKHKPAILWFTGFSGSGKSTVANALEAALNQARYAHLPARWRQRTPRFM